MDQDEYQRLMYGGVVVAECASEEVQAFVLFVLENAGISAVALRHAPKFDLRALQVLVAPDDEARAAEILARPVADDVLEEYRILQESNEVEWTPPKCPACGSPDPQLETSEPCNRWRCEECGGEWLEQPEP